MLRIGLTGGIGSGKSTATGALAELGALVVDADALSREVVAPGTDGLSAVVERFGEGVLDSDGALNRSALATAVFDDEDARRELEAIIHPRIATRTSELMASAAPDQIVVHDVPLLVEKRMGPNYHLVVVIDAHQGTRLERLVQQRGMSEAQARARMDHQASDDQRLAAADVVLSNDGPVHELQQATRALWEQRLVPFDENLRADRVARPAQQAVLADYDPSWASTAQRLTERISAALGERAPEIEHVGSTAVAGMPGKDAIDLQIGVRSLSDADDPQFVQALSRLGFPRIDDYRMDHPTDALPDPSLWVKRFHGSADPGRVVHLHVRELGSAGWQYALLFRDWLRAEPDAAVEYVDVKARLSQEHGLNNGYAEAKAPWFSSIWPRMQAFAQRTGWTD
ncbi:dephospho-CoA kinase [Kineosphaera limosa]|uniref:Dephospho-CoA kinase n=1 Tax=Kineosphaera limosa NBRC 100340 TaxID=1184609 RepID=K6WKU3_9MICO|nr:dephospho-CoA kinase [Kineosphaera limosa]NYE03069.1 dephospho-CoA kinase [Kineosphaera limosa]GAB94406.1 dephospho-CoA kinase [Kineosphaera limosa NBRC 100340]